MPIVSEFEVLFSGLLPVVPLPLVAQGYFLQVSNPTATTQTVTLRYLETSNFANATVQLSNLKLNLLLANYLDGSGTAHAYPDFLANSGFFAIQIPQGQTYVFGLQAFPTPAMNLDAAHPAASDDPRVFVAPKDVPQFGIQWHGYVELTCTSGTSGDALYIYPTTRGVFFDPIVTDTIELGGDVITIGITTGQTYSAVPTLDGLATIALPTS